MSVRVVSCVDRAAAEAACAARLAALLGAALADRAGRVGLLVSGGATPTRVLPLLLAEKLDWDRVDMLASDERLTPLDHPDSTEGMARGLLRRFGRGARYLGPGGLTDPAAAERAWRSAIAAAPWPLAGGLIGVGADGHVASLFPGRPEILDAGLRTAFVPETPPHAHPRLTLGPAALAQAGELVLVAGDAAKRAVLARAGAPLALLSAAIDVTAFTAIGP
ncbi:6-phosphogluconolactonase [Rubrimonas cliftonensis]|uniref:6-phosphogluconolactonase n=1 Tax=Rubrimonas cliftonensis TaxID=89524 RepID=A0A1H4CXT5_9RHOB|nr:6-phosphogluconolactonase [Rubrimonas cliftonensis]SEA65056.1 6-phosphogluconolactonase [Rubrimonas cliftonensis]